MHQVSTRPAPLGDEKGGGVQILMSVSEILIGGGGGGGGGKMKPCTQDMYDNTHVYMYMNTHMYRNTWCTAVTSR